jgi:hypothetical protein
MNQSGHLTRQGPLRVSLLGLLQTGGLELAYPLSVEKRKESQVLHGILIVSIQPELIELIRRRQVRIEPDRSGFRLAKLRP